MRSQKKISVRWKNFIDWFREKPYFEYFLEITTRALMTYMIILVIIVIGLVVALVRTLIKNDLLFATLSAASLAFFATLLSVTVQSWSTLYKNRIEQQREQVNKMTDYYERIQEVLKNPGYFPLKKISSFIDKFDNKVEMYGSKRITYQWKRLKGRIINTQINSLSADSKDWHAFRNFIDAIRKEMGHTSNSTLRYYILKDLKSKYQTKKIR